MLIHNDTSENMLFTRNNIITVENKVTTYLKPQNRIDC